MLPLVLMAFTIAEVVTNRRIKGTDSGGFCVFVSFIAFVWDFLFFASLAHRK